MITQLRQIKQRLQDQSDKIKELEADWLDENTKNQLMSREIEHLEQLRKIEAENKTLNNILIFFDEKLKNNEEYQQVKLDLIGGQEEQIKIEL